jgi:hypothetical protein
VSRERSRRFWRRKAREIACEPPSVYAYQVRDVLRQCRPMRFTPTEMYLFACFGVAGAHIALLGGSRNGKRS